MQITEIDPKDHDILVLDVPISNGHKQIDKNYHMDPLLDRLMIEIFRLITNKKFKLNVKTKPTKQLVMIKTY